MKRNFTFLSLFFITLCVGTATFAQVTGDYRSVNAPNPAGGNWSDITKWERYNGSAWVAAPTAPTFTDETITIRSGDNILLNVSVTADQLVVEAGGTLSINVFFSASGGNDLTLNNGTGTDLTVNGLLILRSFNVINGPGTMDVNGTFNWFSGRLGAVTTTTASAVTNFDLDFAKTLTANLTNAGTINWATGVSPVNITITNCIFTNNGTVNEQFQGNSGFFNGGGTLGFVNNGIFHKTSTNQFANSTVPFTNAGTISGLGGMNLNFLTVTNSGTISPGNSPGILAATESLISGQPTTLAIEVVNGSGAGTGHDQINLNIGAAGATTLSSATLTVTEVGGLAPFQPYTILTTNGTFSGTFATENIPSGYTITYNASSVVVTKIAFPLPAVWGDFTATTKSNAVELNWTTLQEINTSHYVVEHATNGSDFKSIGTIPAAGNSAAVLSYSFKHNNPNQSANNTYRIRLVDLDGKSEYSLARSVRFNKGNVVVVTATPNPFVNSLQIQVLEKNVNINIIDLNGRVHKSLRLQQGVHNINTSELPSGVYTLTIYRENKEVETQRIIKM